MNQEQLLEILDVMKDDLSEDQLQKLGQAGKKIQNPQGLKPEQVMKVLNDVGLDLDVLQAKAKKARAIMNAKKPKKVKIGRNVQCPCNSGKKYKKCCLNKPDVVEHVKNM